MTSLISEYKSSFRLRGWSNLSWMCFHEILSVLYDSKRLQSCETKMWSTKSFYSFSVMVVSLLRCACVRVYKCSLTWEMIGDKSFSWVLGMRWCVTDVQDEILKHKLSEAHAEVRRDVHVHMTVCVCVDIYRTSSDVRVDVNHTKHISALFWDVFGHFTP